MKPKLHPAKTLFLRIHVGTAKRDGKTWEMSTNAGDGSPIIRLPDGRWATFSWEVLIEAANEAEEEKS